MPVLIVPPMPFSRSKLSSIVVALATRPATTITRVDCPIAKKKPTATGRPPACISLRVTLSIVAM